MAACPVCGVVNARGARFCSTCGTKLAPGAPTRETRKTVTVLFADVTGSTALGEQLDPESLRTLMARYFAEMKAIIERHGGTVEKFIGDAVMAVFGIPAVHEDDALRAVRAAAEIRDRLAELNAELTATRGLAIRFRTGLYTGEVVAGDPTTDQTLVTGDTVNTAARLEQAAPPGEILIGRPTYSLVRDAVEAEPVEAIAAKGKADLVPAYRLVSVTPGLEGHARRLDRPLVGRGVELARLLDAYRVAVHDRSPQLVTVLGTAGVGKSRLVAELLGAVVAEATVLKGRCLPYGEGITYWPVREVVHAAAGITEGDRADEARAKVRALLNGSPDADIVARLVGAALGLERDGAPQEEIFWAIRKSFEHVAQRKPLVLLIEDIHWAEPTLLDLIEYILDLAADAPLLLLCPARPELLEGRPGWGGGRASSAVLHLDPLPEGATDALMDALPGGRALPDGLRSRILAAAEGNPLYLEEMIAMLVDEGHVVERDRAWHATGDLERLDVPLSIRALLTARIDALPEPERRVAERASVVGRVFEAAALRELGSGPMEIGPPLLALVRKELLRPERSELSTGDAFKFRHLLIRDAAYEALPKVERAELHERFAGWLERAAGERIAEYDEILGYHYEQAHGYWTVLGETGERANELGVRAVTRLAAAGKRALERNDLRAAVDLLERADRIHTIAADALLALSEALHGLQLFDKAAETGERAALAADELGDKALVDRARMRALDSRTLAEPARLGELEAVAREVLAAKPQQEIVTADACRYLAWSESNRGRWEASAQACEDGLTALGGAGGGNLRVSLERQLILALVLGPRACPDAIDICRAFVEHSASVSVRAQATWGQAVLQFASEGPAPIIGPYKRSPLSAWESPIHEIVWGQMLHRVRDDAAAVAVLNSAADALREQQNLYTLASAAAILADSLVGLGRTDEAANMTDEARDITDATDVAAQVLWRIASARLALARDDGATANKLALEAESLVETTDEILLRADVALVLSDVHASEGRSAKARASGLRAIGFLDQKAATFLAEKVRRDLETQGRLGPRRTL
jgi:class 3 adenylate cyclase